MAIKYLSLNKALLSVTLLLPVSLYAQTPDWSTKVAPVLFNHCTSCHHSGGLAPFPLITYADAVENAASIKYDVQQRKMPPWPPDPNYTHLLHERVLSDAEIAGINGWFAAGMPQGDPSLAPPAPVYDNRGAIPGTPDLVVRIPNYVSTADSNDVYQCFVIPSGLLADKYIRAFEAIPGNPACVHHVLVFADTTGTYAALDSAYPGPGFPYFGGVSPDNTNGLGIWVPGSPPMTLPAGFGIRVAHHSDIVVQIHYPAGTAGLTDSTEIHFFFSENTVREAAMIPLLNFETDLIDGPIYIPANTIKAYQEQHVISPAQGDLSLLGIFPHVHLLARDIKSYGVLPSGDTDRYINIPNWEFHWQNFYMFPKIKKAPVGTMLRAETVYDNTTANEDNPSNPPQDVSEGEKTTDEMMLGIFLTTPYRPGDENIVTDSASVAAAPAVDQQYYLGQQLLDVSPNPATTTITVKCYSSINDRQSISLVNMQGKTVHSFAASALLPQGYSYSTFSIQGIPAGSYVLRLKTTRQVLSKTITIL